MSVSVSASPQTAQPDPSLELESPDLSNSPNQTTPNATEPENLPQSPELLGTEPELQVEPTDVLSALEENLRDEIVAKDSSVESAIESLEILRMREGTSENTEEGAVVERRAITPEELAALIQEGTSDADGLAASDEFDDLKNYVEGLREQGALSGEVEKVWKAYETRIETWNQFHPDDPAIPLELYTKMMEAVNAVAMGQEDSGLGMPEKPFDVQEAVFTYADLMRYPETNREKIIALFKDLSLEEAGELEKTFGKRFQGRNFMEEVKELAVSALEKDDVELASALLGKFSDGLLLSITDELRSTVNTQEEIEEIFLKRFFNADAVEDARILQEHFEAIHEATSPEARNEEFKALQEDLKEMTSEEKAKATVCYELLVGDLEEDILELELAPEDPRRLELFETMYNEEIQKTLTQLESKKSAISEFFSEPGVIHTKETLAALEAEQKAKEEKAAQEREAAEKEETETSKED